ncbi:ABC transporter permease [Aestuariivirga litoralis]|uniref:ABC transporter permease n=1 Tax=Aestuariivirga litoralis TaxID=2650924 RepID=UPI0018C66F04|nr:ABC transporter permease subunit [Aestuariivirga litoralis]MBG1232406.1 ABC transporter permease subunit [Aestuariivirga litoralis]
MSEALKGRSLWVDAWRRLKQNKAAMVSLAYMVLVAVLCVVVPNITGHEFTTQYKAYYRVHPSLESYPKKETLDGEIISVAKRAKLDLKEWHEKDGRFYVTVASDKPIDERVTRYLDRSDSFQNAKLEEKSADGLTLTMSAVAKLKHFYFGTDALGRDLLTRVFMAGRISLIIGMLAGFVAVVIGTIYGSVSGFFGGRVDELMMRVVDILYALPFTLFVIMLVVFFGRNFMFMFIAIGAVLWLDMSRIVRGQTLSLKRQEYVQAAEALGVGTLGILRRHIIPNMLGPIVIYLTLLVPQVIILESFLSFLGLGVQEPMSSWGVEIAEGAANMEVAPYLLFIPTFFLSSTLFALNFIGDGLRDALDPKDR